MPNHNATAPETAHGATIVAGMAKVSAAKEETFSARLGAFDAIMDDASSHDVMHLCAHALSTVIPTCCAAREDEFKADFLRILNDSIAGNREPDETESDASGAGRPVATVAAPLRTALCLAFIEINTIVSLTTEMLPGESWRYGTDAAVKG
jgi:hypothetical protein